MPTIGLNLVSEERFLTWQESIQRKVQSLDGKVCRGILTDVEEATNCPPTGDVTLRFPDTTPFFRARRQLIDTFWPTSKRYQANPGPPPYEKLELRAPGLPYIDRQDFGRTLAELGFASGDFLVLEWKNRSRPLGIAIGRSSDRSIPRTLTEFFQSVVDDPRAKADETRDGRAGLNSLVLYTEEDSNLALYVRQYYGALHIMSGFDLTFYFLEYIPPIQYDRPSLHAFWSSVLPHKWYSVWRTVGLIRSKPFPPARVYEIVRELGLEPAQLPCMVFFLDWRKIAEERMVLRITPPISTFFRQVCSDVHTVIAELAGKDAPAKRANRSGRLPAALRRFVGRTSDAEPADPAISFQEFQSRVPASWTANMSPEPVHPTTTGAEVRHSEAPTIFLCHSSVDKPFVEQLAFDLRNLGLGIWLDKWDIMAGDFIVDRIEKGIEENDYLGVVLSADSIESQWVRREWTAAYLREIEERKVIILPILYRPCEIPLILRGRHHADFTASYEDGLNQLVQRLAPDAVSCLKTVRNIVDSKE